jgi:hypothetical protein
MALARGFEPKTDLTPEEKVKAAYFHLVVGWSQHDIANWCCVNSARVNDAVQAVRRAVEWPENVRMIGGGQP